MRGTARRSLPRRRWRPRRNCHGQTCVQRLKEPMKLAQGQIWKLGDGYLRIVKWERLAIQYKVLQSPAAKDGPLHQVTKKEFCRLLKGAALLPPPQTEDHETEDRRPET